MQWTNDQPCPIPDVILYLVKLLKVCSHRKWVRSGLDAGASDKLVLGWRLCTGLRRLTLDRFSAVTLFLEFKLRKGICSAERRLVNSSLGDLSSPQKTQTLKQEDPYVRRLLEAWPLSMRLSCTTHSPGREQHEALSFPVNFLEPQLQKMSGPWKRTRHYWRTYHLKNRGQNEETEKVTKGNSGSQKIFWKSDTEDNTSMKQQWEAIEREHSKRNE